MANSYDGPVRVHGSDGVLLTIGSASLETEPERGAWTGAIQTLRGTAIAGKALVVFIETSDGKRAVAQLTPMGDIGEYATSGVAGVGEGPF